MRLQGLQEFTCRELDTRRCKTNPADAKQKRPRPVCVTFYVIVVAEERQQDLNPLRAAEAALRLVPQHPHGALNAAAHQGGGVHCLLVVLRGHRTKQLHSY